MTMDYLSLTDAQQLILSKITPLGMEHVALQQALGRVLAEPVRANRDHPPYDVSAMDGYALRAADLHSLPATLTVVEDIKAGALPTMVVLPRQCARIMTGAALPQGADTVVRVEDTTALPPSNVQILVSAAVGKDIRSRGENLRKGDVTLQAGTEITPGVLGILAMLKQAQVLVQRVPRVAILSSGDELEGLQEPFDANKIPDANSYTLMGQLQALGIEPTLLGIARDDPLELADYVMRGLDFDVLLISGGTSVGEYDFVRPVLSTLGIDMHFWRVAIRPGHPMAFGTTPTTQVFCLPGNPVSSMVCFEQFVSPALRKMMAQPRLYRRSLCAKSSHAIRHKPGRTELVRVKLRTDDEGVYWATATATQGSGVLLSMAKADALLIVPAASSGLDSGEWVEVQLLDGMNFQDTRGYVA